MDIQNPRRALAVSLTSDAGHLSRVVQDISGSSPSAAGDSLAGITHDLPIKTKYYTATVPLWLDLIEDASAWASSFCSPEAAEVLAVLGGLIFVFDLPAAANGSSFSTPVAAADRAREAIRQVGRVVRDGLGGWGWDGVKLAVGVGDTTDTDEWDDLCAEAGLEFVQVGGRREQSPPYGEKDGIPRVVEALEANEWERADDVTSADNDGDDDSSNDDDEGGLGLEQTDLETLKKAIWAGTAEVDTGRADDDDGGGGGEDEDMGADDVARVETMMHRLQAARVAGETMSEAQRKKMAAKAVEEVMRDL